MAPRDFLIRLASDDGALTLSREERRELLRRLQRLEQLEKEHGHVRELQEENRRLREEIERLRPALEKARERNARLTDKAEGLQDKLEGVQNSLAVLGTDAKTAAAVGIPSRRTFFRPPPKPPEERKKSGGQPGHPGTTRPRPTPNSPSVVFTLKACAKCAHALGPDDQVDTLRHTVTDLPAPGLSIYDVEAPRYHCPGCGERVHAVIPEGYRGEFGPRLKAYVAEHRALGIPLDKIAELLEMTYGLEVSPATLLAMEEGVAESIDGTYRGLQEEMRDAQRTPHAEGDETSFRVNGEEVWAWAGTSPTLTVYEIHEARSGVTAAEVWAGYRGTLTHDGLQSYNAAKEAVHQMDLVHINRWIQKCEVGRGIEPRGFLREEPPKFTRAGRPPKEFLAFAAGVRKRLAAEVRWVEGHPKATLERRARRYAKAVRSMGRFLARPWKDEDAVHLAKEIGHRLGMLFTFVRIPGTPWNSNGVEGEMRKVAVIRNNSGGRKTETGVWVFERILTVWRTCQKRGLRFWVVVMEKLGAVQSGPGPPSASPGS